ncbi:hypothetical protein COW81_00450 [Candidatus Campbellbacteria bacterium CG22_combo_CG10-13_8_21_14_all_36_13]|uniref:Type II secretion system protein GspF domain-containing protein n=1 Tax=Candidatus Campbellbacteria bacterium CG22_combo_CG10-13_8_21_14_all_36_13 TaxID=1974529 RepID=A0A2H0DYZ5_9BACT|nr:MAG: hypothetical protein COW81_00450 [Candidatus Campbellbacteria bacterium CG22_combo_CG10-13_8_21_14_all_36_13]
MKYKYKAIKKGGEIYEDFADAKSEEDLYRLLKEKEETLVFAELNGKSNLLEKVLSIFTKLFGRVKEEDKINFANNLGSMIEAGLAVSRALDVMSRQTKNKKFKEVISNINNSLRKGQTLSSGLEAYPDIFSSIFVSMVRSGEESGNLGGSLKLVANQLDKAYKLKRKIKGAMIYPAIILSAMVVVGALMLIFIVPTLSATFEELKVELPKSTQFIIFISNLLKDHLINTLLVISLVCSAFIYWKRTNSGKKLFHKLVLKIPIIGTLVIETNTARTARTLSSLLTSGVEIVRATEITEEVIQNVHFKEVIKEAGKKVQGGATLSEIFKSYENLYPPLINEMMAVGEETGQLPELLMRVAVFYEEDIDEKTKNMSTIIEPFLMVIIGTVVGFFAISMITPMYSLSNSI